MTSWLVGSPRSGSRAKALPEFIRVQRSFLSSSLVECGNSAGILTENQFLSSSSVLES
jgi:hypothetical protein